MTKHAVTERKAVNDSDVARFDGLSVSTIVDAMYQLGLPEGALEPSVRHIAGPRIQGRARTVGRIVIPRNTSQAAMHPKLGMALYEVIDSLTPGDVLVISAEGDATYSTFGDNMALRCSLGGAVGVVTDAAVRDSAEIGELGFGAYAGGVSIRPGQFRLLTVSADAPIVCGGVLVNPGDVVVGDVDGVVVIPAKDAEEVAKRAIELTDAENRKQKSVREGMSIVEAIRTYKVR
jgi:regulator of RNase E activity RraA